MSDAKDRLVNAAASRGGLEGPTPVRILARLAPDPGAPPVGFTVITADDLPIGSIKTGDQIGIDGRWSRVTSCHALNGWVTVTTPLGFPSVTSAFRDAPVHLARVVDLEGIGLSEGCR
ncbi:hypothetical protein [Catenulispora rubra]|uniref:hypothetical protein n=1 Tax=Catenulispora rubra TaxID=280293 RepID=UPI0018921217|nr:hypothetical protein [Catenulispora rubra]